MAPELTVGLIVHNDLTGLVQSAASVLNQSWTGHVTLKVVDDGSTDDTKLGAERLEERYSHVQLIRNKRHTGIAHARNQVVRTVEHGFLAWIDAGDLWHPRKLEFQFQALNEASSCRFVTAQFPACLRYGFTALLGEKGAYHQLNELDEHLRCLADEEFLIRMILSGIPVATSKSDEVLHIMQRDRQKYPCQLLAEDVNVIWCRHKHTMKAQLGWRVAASYRHQQFLALARGASLNGRPWRKAYYEGTAQLIRLVAGTGRGYVVELLTAPFYRFARRTAKRLLYLGAWSITASGAGPRNPLITCIVQLLGRSNPGRLRALVPAFANFLLPEPVVFDVRKTGTIALSTAEKAALAVAAAAIAATKPARAINVLEAHVVEHDLTHPFVFERLAIVYQLADQLELAADTLHRGLSFYPSNVRFHLALADTLARLSKWMEAKQHWEKLPDDLRVSASVWTIIGIARAYRLTGNPKEADTLVQRARAVQSANDQLEREIHLCRPIHVDWPSSLVSVDYLHCNNSIERGFVDSMGFLEGGTEPLTGQITKSDKTFPDVNLWVNDLQVASTVAVSTSGPAGVKVFSINCTELLQYLGSGDIVRVMAEGVPLTLPGLGAATMVHCDLATRFDVLQDKQRKGYVFTKEGRLCPGHDGESKSRALDFFAKISSFINANSGQPVYPFYGNLLGAIRENDFIRHDVGGFDMVVLCAGTQPSEVKAEVAAICHSLLKEGYHLKINAWSIMIRHQRSDTLFLDMSYGWINPAGDFNVSYGWRFRPVQKRDRFTAHRVCWIADREVSVPGNAEEVLEQLYGPNWRVPDQGFSDRRRLKRDEAYLFNDSEIEAINSSAEHWMD